MSNKIFSNIKGDVFGGINAGIVALPAALGFGALAGLEPIYGLYGAIFLGLIAAVVGGTKTLISNPTGPMAVVTGAIVLDITKKLNVNNLALTDSINVIWPYLMMIIMLAGLVQILFGVLKFGKYVHYIPTPVISGFMSGIGVIIIVSQLKPLLGDGSKVRGTLNILGHLPEMISNADLTSIAICGGTMAIVYLFPKITKLVPSPLVAILGVTVVTYFIGLDQSYLITKFEGGLPSLRIGEIFASDGQATSFLGFIAFPDGMLSFIIGSAFYLAAIGTIDALLTAVVADQLTKERHNSDRELMGQGLGNMVAGMFGGMMGAGTTPSTVLNINSGGRTRLSGIIHAVMLIIVLLVAADVAAFIPKAALAGILIPVGISILDFEVFKQLKKIPKLDNYVMITVLTLTSMWDLMYAVATGLIMAALIFMKKMADVVELDSKDTKFDRLVNMLIDTFPNSDEFREKVYIKNLRGPMFFGFASRFTDTVDEIKDKKVVVLNFGGVSYMDQSGMYTLQESIKLMVDKGLNVCLSELREKELELLEGIGVIPDLVDKIHVFSSVEECVMWLNEPGHLDNMFHYDDRLYIPSAYTPNGDGINDEWQIRNIENFPNCLVKIYTREGNQIFESVGYKEMWEGYYNGKMLPSDTYRYEIDLHGDGSEVRKGTVHIFR